MNFVSPQIRELDALLRKQGSIVIGQVFVSHEGIMRHCEDEGREGLEAFSQPEMAREIAQYDEMGNYRPLKTAPNLKKGWILKLDSIDAVKLALDFFYPAAWGTWLAFKQNRLVPVNLRETLCRQSGMYRVAHKITDGEAREIIAETCDTANGCLRRILWQINLHVPHAPLPQEKFSTQTTAREIPVLCAEACNILVAAMRRKVKEGRGE